MQDGESSFRRVGGETCGKCRGFGPGANGKVLQTAGAVHADASRTETADGHRHLRSPVPAECSLWTLAGKARRQRTAAIRDQWLLRGAAFAGEAASELAAGTAAARAAVEPATRNSRRVGFFRDIKAGTEAVKRVTPAGDRPRFREDSETIAIRNCARIEG